MKATTWRMTSRRESLKELQHLKIPRPYTRVSPIKAQHKELCVFADASDKATAAVAYLKITDAEENCHTGFGVAVVHHTDSKVVLGYIYNEKHRFYV